MIQKQEPHKVQDVALIDYFVEDEAIKLEEYIKSLCYMYAHGADTEVQKELKAICHKAAIVLRQ